MGTPKAWYNDNDKAAAHVLRCLVEDGLLPPGDVDDRSIKDIQPDDLDGYTQCHFFAGAGLWPLAARIAGWPDDRPLWTGSCPCQPFSAAGKGRGTDDPRHLWPDFFRLIRAKRPPVIMGEQVAGAPGYGWFDGVRADLAGEDFASRVCDIPACAVGAPHIRQRLWWIAVEHASSHGRLEGVTWASSPRYGGELAATDSRDNGAVVDTTRVGWREGRTEHEFRGGRAAVAGADASDGSMGHSVSLRLEGQRGYGDNRGEPGRLNESSHGSVASPDGRKGSAWADHEWIVCHDGKARRTEPGLRLLVDGMAGRIQAWRLAGNSISPILAAEVIAAYLDAERLRLTGAAA